MSIGNNGTFKIEDFDEKVHEVAKKTEYKKEEIQDNEIVKVSLSMSLKDWLDIVRFKNYKILELKKVDYTVSDAILYGLSLLESKHKIERGREKVNLKEDEELQKKLN